MERLVPPHTRFEDWEDAGASKGPHREDRYALKICSEEDVEEDIVPAHVVGLASSRRSTQIFLLDTDLGIVH